MLTIQVISIVHSIFNIFIEEHHVLLCLLVIHTFWVFLTPVLICTYFILLAHLQFIAIRRQKLLYIKRGTRSDVAVGRVVWTAVVANTRWIVRRTTDVVIATPTSSVISRIGLLSPLPTVSC